MLSLVIAAAVAVVFGVTGTLLFDIGSGVLIGLGAGIPTYILLARRAGKRAEKAMAEVEGHMRGQRFEMAIKSLESMRPLARWSPLLGSSIDAQIGMLKYAYLRDVDGALPYLEKANPRLWQAVAMLAAAHFRKKRYEEMQKVFELAVKKNKKQGLLWATYSWCEWKRGDKDKSLSILARALEALPNDQKLKTHQQAIANGKKPKMQAYGAEWLALHLEGNLPSQPPGGPRQRFMPPPNKVGLRGRRARMQLG